MDLAIQHLGGAALRAAAGTPRKKKSKGPAAAALAAGGDEDDAEVVASQWLLRVQVGVCGGGAWGRRFKAGAAGSGYAAGYAVPPPHTHTI